MYWGNRNWRPFLEDTVREMADAGVQRAIAFVTSAYSSYSACRQYYDDLDKAIAAVGPRAPRIDKIRPYFNHPGFVEPFAASVADALATLPAGAARRARGWSAPLTASPTAMAAASGSQTAGTAVRGAVGGRYAAELGEASRLISERAVVGSLPFDLVYQSRSGPPSVPWLAPDVNDHLRRWRAEGGASGVVVAPVGFVSDHMEVVHDLDVEAAQTAASLGLAFARAKAPGATPRFAQMVCELVAERTAGAPALALGAFGLGAFAGGADGCPADCCRYSAALGLGAPPGRRQAFRQFRPDRPPVPPGLPAVPPRRPPVPPGLPAVPPARGPTRWVRPDEHGQPGQPGGAR